MDSFEYELVSFPFASSRKLADRDKRARSHEEYYNAYREYLRGIEFQFNISDEEINFDFIDLHNNVKSTKKITPLYNQFIIETEERIKKLTIENDKNEGNYYLKLSIMQLSALLAENRFANFQYPNRDGIPFSLAIEAEIASYMSWKALKDSEDDVNSSINVSLNKFETEKKNIFVDITTKINETEKNLLGLQDSFLETKSLLNEYSVSWKEIDSSHKIKKDEIENSYIKISKEISNIEENWDSFKSVITEKVLGAETKKLWQDRDKENWAAFIVSACILAIFLIVLPIVSFYNLDFILATLKHIGDAATEGIPKDATATQLTVATISRLVVITFPLVLYVWIIRLIVRFNSRSLLLHDDARQRQTMMDTYFMLIERQAATPEERGLILNALFRPAPGYGADNVDPPNFTDLIGKLDKP